MQRSRALARALARLDRESATDRSDLDLREWLFGFDGIGMKTASWITRNHFGSDNVAILDIHVFRAGVLARLFDASDSVARHYRRLEARFLEFAKGLGVRASILDALIWAEMRQMAPLALECLDATPAAPSRSISREWV
jgi:thermostable 8-oxoguanine DNA glycosylase